MMTLQPQSQMRLSLTALIPNRKLSEKIESSEKNPQPLEKEIKPASSSSTKSKATSKPKMRCELCNYTTHTTDDCYRILFCMICKKDDHRTSDHLSYTVSSSAVSYHNAQSHNYASGSKQVRLKAKPFTPCTHCGFNDHLPDDCLMYPCCDICGSNIHTTTDHGSISQFKRPLKLNPPESRFTRKTNSVYILCRDMQEILFGILIVDVQEA